MQKINHKISLIVIIAVLLAICTMIIYFTINKFSKSSYYAEIIVNSNYSDATVTLLKEEEMYQIISTSKAPADFNDLAPGIYMVAVSADNSGACAYAEKIDLKSKQQYVVNANIDLNNLCLD